LKRGTWIKAASPGIIMAGFLRLPGGRGQRFFCRGHAPPQREKYGSGRLSRAVDPHHWRYRKILSPSAVTGADVDVRAPFANDWGEVSIDFIPLGLLLLETAPSS
jgi:hypothetical protein